MNKIKIHLLTAATAVLFSASSLHGVLFTDTFDYPETGNINTGTNANQNGWWASSIPENVRIAALNSPFTNPGTANTNSVRIFHSPTGGTSGSGSLYHTFVGTDDATGSVGYEFTAVNQPANLGFIWDFRNPTVSGTTNRPQFFIGSGDSIGTAANAAIRIGVNSTFDEFVVQGWTGTAPAYAHNTWFRFEVLNVDIANQTYDLNIYSESNMVNPFFSETGLALGMSHSLLKFRGVSC